MLAAVILAAGESRRMGQPKATLPFPDTEATPGKVTFLEHLLSVSRHPKVGVLRVVLGGHADKVRKRVPLQLETVVQNPDWQQGQLSSMQAAVRSLATEGVDGMLLFLVDHPLVGPALVATLIEQFYSSGKLIVLPTYRGKRGHPLVFSSRLFAELLTAPAEVGARAVVWAHSADVLEVPTEEEGVVLNLNDPKAYRRALKERQ